MTRTRHGGLGAKFLFTSFIREIQYGKYVFLGSKLYVLKDGFDKIVRVFC
jgi:hypothetical protein